MATARSALRELMCDTIQADRFIGLSTTSAGAADGTTLIDTGLVSLPGGGDNDFCEGWYVLITELVSGGPAVGESQRITDYASATNTITTVAFTAQVKSGTSYELHRYDPQDLNNAINQACELSYPHLYTAKRDETLITDQLLLNGSLDTFSATFTSWSNIGTPTLAAETTRKVHGSGSASIVASGATEGIEQNLFTRVNYREVVGKTLHARAWSFATVASAVRARVTFDGTTFTDTPNSWHGGDAEWENDQLQYIDVAIPADATEMTVSCEVTDGNTGYFDLVRAWIDPIYRYTIPTAIIRGPFRLSIQGNVDEPDGLYEEVTDWHFEEDSSGRYIVLDRAHPPGRILRVEGTGILTTMSSDSDTTEVDAPKTHLLVARALQYMYEQLAADAALADRDMYERDALKWAQRFQELVRTPGMRMQRRAFQAHPHRYWGV